jgi:hypothetical protein
MEVKIEVGQPIDKPADNSGAAFKVYPVTVIGTHDKRLERTTLSVDGSGVAQSPSARLTYNVSSRDYEPGSHKLFASAWDGEVTVTAETTMSIAGAAPKPAPSPAPMPSPK